MSANKEVKRSVKGSIVGFRSILNNIELLSNGSDVDLFLSALFCERLSEHLSTGNISVKTLKQDVYNIIKKQQEN